MDYLVRLDTQVKKIKEENFKLLDFEDCGFPFLKSDSFNVSSSERLNPIEYLESLVSQIYFFWEIFGLTSHPNKISINKKIIDNSNLYINVRIFVIYQED
jgi:hypothetical protein